MGGGSWPRRWKKRKTRPDIARRREGQRDYWESCNHTRKRRILRSDTHWPSRRVVRILFSSKEQRAGGGDAARLLNTTAYVLLLSVDCAWFLFQLHHTFIARTNPKTLRGLARALSESALQYTYYALMEIASTTTVLLVRVYIYVLNCQHFQQSMDQPGEVANPANG